MADGKPVSCFCIFHTRQGQSQPSKLLTVLRKVCKLIIYLLHHWCR